jgi:hypothetical protein
MVAGEGLRMTLSSDLVGCAGVSPLAL